MTARERSNESRLDLVQHRLGFAEATLLDVDASADQHRLIAQLLVTCLPRVGICPLGEPRSFAKLPQLGECARKVRHESR